MAATAITAVTTLEEKRGGENEEAVLEIVVKSLLAIRRLAAVRLRLLGQSRSCARRSSITYPQITQITLMKETVRGSGLNLRNLCNLRILFRLWTLDLGLWTIFAAAQALCDRLA